MATYRMKRPQSGIQTVRFDDYRKAREFSDRAALLGATKPYKRITLDNGATVPAWFVTLASSFKVTMPEYVRIA